MKLDKFIRIVLGLLIVVVFLVAIGALLFFTQTALNVWDRLLEGPQLLRWGYVGAMIGLVARCRGGRCRRQRSAARA
jgi:hypothetical protein